MCTLGIVTTFFTSPTLNSCAKIRRCTWTDEQKKYWEQKRIDIQHAKCKTDGSIVVYERETAKKRFVRIWNMRVKTVTLQYD